MPALSDAVLESLRAIVGPDQVRTDADSLAQFGRDWTRIWEPAPACVVLPKTTDEVQAIVRLANAQQLALVPSGGRTGLSGGAVAHNGEVVLALDRMNQIQAFDPVDRTLRVQAGVITEQLQQAAADKGLFYPVDFASTGSSQIGGNIGTNAGGIKVLRYGMTRDWVLGLQVVTGAGEVLELNGSLVKNNTGLDLKQLFIGGEGILGVVTEATIKLTTPPKPLTVLVLGVNTMAQVMDVLQAFQQKLALTAFEFFSHNALEKVTAAKDLPKPFESEAPYYALIEYENLGEGDLDTAMNVFEHCVEQGWVIDGAVSQSEQQAANLWRLREDISETLAEWKPYKNDLAVPVSKVPGFVEAIHQLVTDSYPDFEVVWFGHIGDGNVHLNILKPESLAMDDFVAKCNAVSYQIFALTQSYQGSVSAEHGVGLLKKPYLRYSRSEQEIALMKGIKQVLDPNGVMNPGKVFD